MDQKEVVVIVHLVLASFIVFAASVILAICHFRKKRKKPETYNRTGLSGTLLFSIALIFSIWLLRFAVEYPIVFDAAKEEGFLAYLEGAAGSLFATLRTFAMEEDYATYILQIKGLVEALYPSTLSYFPYVQGFMVGYTTLLNFLAPVIGGALILEIVSSIFPKIALVLSYGCLRRTKYFFSELNAASLALAKSIRAEKKRAVLIFTDTHIDDEEEKDYELFMEAKRIGAICVRDDLSHITKPKFGKREYHLINENEFDNFQTLMGLLEPHNIRFLKRAHIYLFVQTDAYVQIEKQVNLTLENEKWKKRFKGNKKPVIVPVFGYRNIVNNLFLDVPLYEPLVHKKEDANKLKVTIFGDGLIGTESFLGTYWMGQMLQSKLDENGQSVTECEVTINMVSNDSADDFWNKIDYVNPEIQKTVALLGPKAQSPDQTLLTYNEAGAVCKPYCKVRHITSDLKIGGTWDENSEDAQHFMDSDYFIVALGNDSDNIAIAEKLRGAVGRKHMRAEDEGKKVVIAYAVFDSKLVSVLNVQKHICSVKGKGNDIYMHAFGSLEQVYSCHNVYMSRDKLLAQITGQKTGTAAQEKAHRKENRERVYSDTKSCEETNYDYWARLARASHIQYKVFSLGWISTSVFDGVNEEIHRKNVNAQCACFCKVAAAKNPEVLTEEEQQKYADLQLKSHCYGWLEHRRWNAFTRTMGYQFIDVHEILSKKGAQKDMQLKLHSCLVEARLPDLTQDNCYMLADLEAQKEQWDALDVVSSAMHTEYKKYDYPQYELPR